MLVSNASFTVMGTATDNVAVASVYCSLSNAVVNSGFAPAMTANNWANWSTNVTLAPGTNTVRAYAVDTSGNLSTTNSATLVYILSAPLTVQTNGLRHHQPELQRRVAPNRQELFDDRHRRERLCLRQLDGEHHDQRGDFAVHDGVEPDVHRPTLWM